MTLSKSQHDPALALVLLIEPLLRLARILASTPDQAEDLAQEALLQVWTRLKRGHKIENLRPYLMATLRNARRHVPRNDQELNDANTPSCLPDAWRRIACQDVNAAVALLPEEQRELLRPFVQSGASYKDLAMTHDLPIGTVMSRIARARTRLRYELDLPANHAVEELLEAPT